MATRYEGTNIHITRGDTAPLDFLVVVNQTDEVYELTNRDTLIFRLKRKPTDSTILIEKTLPYGHFWLDTEDTASLPFGTYRYSLELVTSGGFHETIVEPERKEGLFVIGKENENHD